MCGYVGQNSTELDVKRLHYLEDAIQDYRPVLAKADWLEDRDILDTLRPKPIVPKPVGGIGDFFTIFFKSEDSYYKDWSKFGSDFPWGKGVYYNATIEKIETYFEEESTKRFDQEVMESVLERPCVLFVDRFWENHQVQRKNYFKFERSDKEYIPLAGFYKDISDEKGNYKAFTLITRDPYPAVESIGHLRSPVILDDRLVLQWTKTNLSFEERLDIVGMPPAKVEYDIDQVAPSTVTKRMEEGLESIKMIQEKWTLNNAF